MNPIAEVAVPAYDTPLALFFLVLLTGITGVRMLMTINTSHWGSNRLLYIMSGGSLTVGRVLAPLPGLMFIGVAIWAAGRMVGFF